MDIHLNTSILLSIEVFPKVLFYCPCLFTGDADPIIMNDI